MEKEVLKITDLDFSYDNKRYIYKNFSLEVKKGEIVTILGESGSGKSTLFELITSNLKPLKGEIKVANFSQIFQDPYSSFHPTYTIIEQIKDVTSTDINEELLKRLNLDKSLLYKKPHLLSGGQLQRCSILRALLMKPSLLLADEPTSALDNITGLEVMKLLVGFLDEIGILLITHDEELASWCSDRVVRLES